MVPCRWKANGAEQHSTAPPISPNNLAVPKPMYCTVYCVRWAKWLHGCLVAGASGARKAHHLTVSPLEKGEGDTVATDEPARGLLCQGEQDLHALSVTRHSGGSLMTSYINIPSSAHKTRVARGRGWRPHSPTCESLQALHFAKRIKRSPT